MHHAPCLPGHPSTDRVSIVIPVKRSASGSERRRVSRWRRRRSPRASHFEFDDLLSLLAETIDAERDHVSGLEKLWLGFHSKADAGGSTRDDHVARLQHE